MIFGTALDGYQRTYDNNGNLTLLFLDACHVLKTSIENLFWHKQSFDLRLNNGIIDDSRGAIQTDYAAMITQFDITVERFVNAAHAGIL